MNQSRLTLSASPSVQLSHLYKLGTSPWLLVISLVPMLSLVLLLTLHWDVVRLLSYLRQWTNPGDLTQLMAHSGGWGPAMYIAIITVSVVISQIPGAPLAVAAGVIWDPFLAGMYTIIGGFGGALIAYGLGRLIGPAIVKMLTGKTLSLSTDHGTAYLGWLIFVTRLFPIFSFDLVSYGAGMTRLSFPIYASATFFGMIPSTLLLTYMGSSFHWSAGAIAAFLILFMGAFVCLPVVLHRFDFLNIKGFIGWTE